MSIHTSAVDISVSPARFLLGAIALMTLCVVTPLPALHASILPIALLAPGYAVMAAIFGFQPRFDAALTLALCLLLSLSLYVVLSLGLYVLAIRLSMPSVLCGTDLLVVALCRLAVLRARRSVPVDAWPATSPDSVTAAGSLADGIRRIARFAVPLAAIGVALLVFQGFLPRSTAAPYSDLSLAGSWSHLDTIVYARADGSLAVQIAIANHTHASQTYNLAAFVDGSAQWQKRTVQVAVNQQWIGTVQATVSGGGCVHQLRIDMREGHAGVLAGRLTLWVRGARGILVSCSGGSQ